MYEHVQRSPLHIFLYLPAIFAFMLAWHARDDAPPSVTVAVVGILLLLLSFSFQTLTTRGESDYLVVRYGPLNLFGTRIAYQDITSVEPSTTSLIDGWGIHFIPFRGWTFNLWGFECVKLTLGTKVIRIGTDDSVNLTKFLSEKILTRQS